MGEYIIHWDGIGATLSDMLRDRVPLALWPKRIRQERLREPIVRCRDCDNATEAIWPESSGIPADWLNCHGELVETWDYYNDEPKDNPVPPDGFCMYGELRRWGE